MLCDFFCFFVILIKKYSLYIDSIHINKDDEMCIYILYMYKIAAMWFCLLNVFIINYNLFTKYFFCYEA